MPHHWLRAPTDRGVNTLDHAQSRRAINSFYSLLHAQVVIGDWKTEYNHQRRHSSLGYLPPAEYARQCTHQIETDDSQSDRTE